MTPLDVSSKKSTKPWFSLTIGILTLPNLWNRYSISVRNSIFLIRLFDEHFACHFESLWRETWRHTGARTETPYLILGDTYPTSLSENNNNCEPLRYAWKQRNEARNHIVKVFRGACGGPKWTVSWAKQRVRGTVFTKSRSWATRDKITIDPKCQKKSKTFSLSWDYKDGTCDTLGSTTLR